MRYIRRGWLPADRRPAGGGLGQYIIRQKAIDAFLQDDPRPGNRSQRGRYNRKKALRKEKQRRYRLRKKMDGVDWRGKGIKVKNCPVGRDFCHQQCPARGESRCHYLGRIGTELRLLTPR